MADELTTQFQELTARVGNRAAAVTAAIWRNLPGHDETDIDEFVRRSAPALNGAKLAAVTLAVAYYSLLVRSRPPAVNSASIVVPDETREPFIAYWTSLKRGHSVDVARLSGIARAEAVARNLTISASRRAGDLTLERTGHRPRGWERITDANACEWCRDVAGQTYTSAEAADFGHDRCGCSVSPILI